MLDITTAGASPSTRGPRRPWRVPISNPRILGLHGARGPPKGGVHPSPVDNMPNQIEVWVYKRTKGLKPPPGLIGQAVLRGALGKMARRICQTVPKFAWDEHGKNWAMLLNTLPLTPRGKKHLPLKAQPLRDPPWESSPKRGDS
ncbi:hypothetical protein TNIN_374561 [Trichonephila inaurata madagascariensis]|uniref:Uncharacterized protein n=1 Tax=Trichonephila inaurata madagascariensis TaxID=2747483 RepID=A0A8X6YVD3_9ARAC|nr:hypothetical protein TNIN_374561 [Trichonephila inaurata madagascariensis]